MKAVKKFWQWCLYWVLSKNKNGHGVHSPFVFNFIENVSTDSRQFYAFEQYATIAIHKYKRLLFLCLHHYKPNTVVFDEHCTANDILFYAAAMHPQTIAYVTPTQFKALQLQKTTIILQVYAAFTTIQVVDNTWFILKENTFISNTFSNTHANCFYYITYTTPQVTGNLLQQQLGLQYCYIHLFTIGLLACRKEQLQTEYFSIQY